MIKCGIIGYGRIGRTRAREILNNENTELIAIYDKYLISEKPDRVILCESVDELIDQDIQAVFICAYNKVAAPYTIKALGAGKHVFCEKPPARTSDEVRQVIEAENKSGMVLKYGFNHRYHYSVMEAAKLIKNNTFGKLLWLRGIYGKAGGNQFTKSWRNDPKLSGGGILIDQGIHMLDLIRFFAGEFEVVDCIVQTSCWDIPVEDNAFVLMKNNDGVSAMVHSSATQWRHKFSLDMCFEEGYINLEGILTSTRSYGDETLILARKQFEDSAYAMGKPREERIFFDTDDSWKFELQEFVEAIQNKYNIHYGNSSDALQVMLLTESIYNKSKFDGNNK